MAQSAIEKRGTSEKDPHGKVCLKERKRLLDVCLIEANILNP